MSGSGLTSAELSVFVLMTQGLSDDEIASRLDTNPSSVKEHVSSVYEKLGVSAELRALLGPTDDRGPAAGDLSELSNREREVLGLVADGLSNEEIAERLCLSVRTVERHLSNIYAKFGISGKTARAAAAVRYSRSG